MNSRAIVGISFAAVFAVSMIISADAFHQAYMSGLSDTVSQGPLLTTVSVTSTASKIPAHTFDLAGFAWGLAANPSGSDFFAVTTHHGVKDSTQRPNQWHVHNVDTGAGAGAAELCILDIQNAPLAKINIKNNTLTATLPSTSVNGVIAPGVVPADIIIEPLCPSFTKIAGVATGLKLGLDAAP